MRCVPVCLFIYLLFILVGVWFYRNVVLSFFSHFTLENVLHNLYLKFIYLQIRNKKWPIHFFLIQSKNWNRISNFTNFNRKFSILKQYFSSQIPKIMIQIFFLMRIGIYMRFISKPILVSENKSKNLILFQKYIFNINIITHFIF